MRGRANLLDGAEDAAQLERIRSLFDDLERKRDLAQLLDLTEGGEGVRVFIGSENKLFSLSGSSLVVSPYMNADRKIIGAVGVIGPTRLNYGRIVPIVDYTAQLVGRLVSSRGRAEDDGRHGEDARTARSMDETRRSSTTSRRSSTTTRRSAPRPPRPDETRRCAPRSPS